MSGRNDSFITYIGKMNESKLCGETRMNTHKITGGRKLRKVGDELEIESLKWPEANLVGPANSPWGDNGIIPQQ